MLTKKPTITPSDIERFQRKISISTERFYNDTACHEWTACKLKDGYGHFRLGGGLILAHRFAYMAANGEVPAGLSVCHACDNPACCNPAHLFTGTHKENMDDRDRKGRGRINRPRGDKHWHTKIKDEHVPHIRLLRSQGMSLSKIARQLNVSISAIAHILAGRRKTAVT